MPHRPFPPSLDPTDPDYTRERYTTSQAAAYLQMARCLMTGIVARGEISYRRVSSRKYLFSQADLDQFRAGQREEARPVSMRRPRPAAREAASGGAVLPMVPPSARRFS